MTVQPPSDTYALGRSASETYRLILQNQIYGPFTRQFLTAAGITTGMRVLDLGSGAGDVVLLLTELVGPEGRVVGVDMNAEILATARARVEAAGWTNVRFHHGDVRNLDVDVQFDAVVGRWVLMYVPEPVDLLRHLASRLRVGGIVAFQESDLRTSARAYPSGPVHDQVRRLTTPPPGVPGPDMEMGPKLYRVYRQAGLPRPHLRLDAPIGGGAEWPGYAYLTATLRSLLPFLEQRGVLRSEEVDIETLEDRLRQEVTTADGVQILPALIGAWTRTVA